MPAEPWHTGGCPWGSDVPSTIERQISMLRAVPREPQRISVSELVQRLHDDGHNITARTVQRDLNDLSLLFGLQNETEGRMQYWFYPKNFRGMDIPGMGVAEALVFRMAELYLSRALPSAQVRHLEPYFKQARTVIEQERVPLHRWRKRVRIIERGPQLKIPDVKNGVMEVLHEALLHQKRARLSYIPRGETDISEYDASVHAIVIRDSVIYAVVTLRDYEDLRHIAAHRVQSAQLEETDAQKPKQFDLDDYLGRQKMFSYPSTDDKQINLKLRIDRNVFEHLEERPISDNQHLLAQKDGQWELSATVLNTAELRWWILGFGEQVEVREPESLRRDVRRVLAHTLQRYNQP